jgi:hypothetical protein
VKKLFLVLLVLLAGIAGLSAAPLRPGGGDEAPLSFIPREGTAIAFAAPGIPEAVRPATVFVVAQDNKAAFARDLELICLWFGQYQEGLLSANDFKTLVAGRITVMYMRGQAIEDIQRMAILAPAKYPLLC